VRNGTVLEMREGPLGVDEFSPRVELIQKEHDEFCAVDENGPLIRKLITKSTSGLILVLHKN